MGQKTSRKKSWNYDEESKSVLLKLPEGYILLRITFLLSFKLVFHYSFELHRLISFPTSTQSFLKAWDSVGKGRKILTGSTQWSFIWKSRSSLCLPSTIGCFSSLERPFVLRRRVTEMETLYRDWSPSVVCPQLGWSFSSPNSGWKLNYNQAQLIKHMTDTSLYSTV